MTIDKAAINARLTVLGLTASQISSLTPTNRVATFAAMAAEAQMPTPDEQARLDYALSLQVEAAQLHNLCERTQLSALGVDTSGVPIATPPRA